MSIIYKLNKLINYERKGGFTKNLLNFYELLESVGNPHRKLKNVIHIVGTKGKGSTANIISQSLIKAGFNVGLFTSPHLVSPLERIRVNNEPIKESELEEIAGKILEKTNGMGFQTYFEVLTASSMLYFLKKNTDFNVFEAGLGGRLDATNVLNQRVIVITRIDYDHIHILGDFLESIAYEKSAVIKGKTPVITTINNMRVMDVIEKRARMFGADIHIVDWKVLKSDKFGLSIEVEGKEISAPLKGRFQAENLALSYKTLKILGIENPDFSNIHIPGRFHIFSENPLIVLDVSHNTLSVREFLRSLKEFFPERKMNVVLALSSDKDMEGIIKEISQYDYRLYLVRYPSPRAAWVEDLFKVSIKYGITPRILTSTAEILSLMNEGNVAILGTFYLVGEVMAALKYQVA